MQFIILSLVAIVTATYGYLIEIPGQCPPESTLKLNKVNYDLKTIADEYYNILLTNKGPNYGIESKRITSWNADKTLGVTEVSKTLSGDEETSYFTVSEIPNSKSFILKRYGNDKSGPIVDELIGYLLHYDDKADIYAAYGCRNTGADTKEVELAVWSRKRTRVDEDIFRVVAELVRANDLYDIFKYLQIVQQPCCKIEDEYCSA